MFSIYRHYITSLLSSRITANRLVSISVNSQSQQVQCCTIMWFRFETLYCTNYTHIILLHSTSLSSESWKSSSLMSSWKKRTQCWSIHIMWFRFETLNCTSTTCIRLEHLNSSPLNINVISRYVPDSTVLSLHIYFRLGAVGLSCSPILRNYFGTL